MSSLHVLTAANTLLYLELKRVKGGRVSKEQKEYLARLKEENYCATADRFVMAIK